MTIELAVIGGTGVYALGELADARFASVRERLRAVPETSDAIGADSGAIDVGNVA